MSMAMTDLRALQIYNTEAAFEKYLHRNEG